MKQTAVEWLFLMLNNPNRNQDFANKLLEKAKAMEKEQIMDAHLNGYIDGGNQKSTTEQQYYNETFIVP
jgi:hypothetical protein